MQNVSNEINSSTTIDMLKDCSPCNNKLVKMSDKHAKFLLENLNLLRRQKELCDVILIVGQSKIPAHRAILSGEEIDLIMNKIYLLFLFFSMQSIF